MAERKAFVFVMTGTGPIIIKSLTARQASCYNMTDSLRQQSAWVSDFTGATDAYIRDSVRAKFDPSYAGYTGGGPEVPPAPLPYVMTKNVRQRIDPQSAPTALMNRKQQTKQMAEKAFAFEKLPENMHQKAIDMYKLGKYQALGKLLLQHQVITCLSCGVTDKIQRWMTWGIKTGALKSDESV